MYEDPLKKRSEVGRLCFSDLPNYIFANVKRVVIPVSRCY